MSTSNFYKVHAKQYYAVNVEDWDVEYMSDYIKEVLHNITPQYKDDDENTFPELSTLRDYPSRCIAEMTDKWLHHELSNLKISIGFHIIAGYYKGATLDYDICIENDYCRTFLSEYYNVHNMVDDMTDYVINQAYDYEDDFVKYKDVINDFKELCKYEVAKAIEIAEKVCQTIADDTLRCTAQFSNGEALYEKVN